MAKTLSVETRAAPNLAQSVVQPAPRLKARGAKPKPLLNFMPFQQPKLVSAPPSGAEWRHEIKWDGYRMQMIVEGGRARWFSRNGHDWTDRLKDFDTTEVADGVFDGEMIVMDDRGHPDFSSLRSHMGARQRGHMTGDLTFMVFDILADDSGDLRSKPLRDRKVALEAALEGLTHHRIRESEPLPGGGSELLQAACRMGLEGIVSKRIDAPYQGGETRFLTWQKSKCRPSQEVVIGGFEMDGTRFKSLLAGVFDGDEFVYVGSIGTGFGQAVVTGLLPRLRAVESATSPYTAGGPPRKTSSIRWTRPELVAAAEIAEWTGSGKLRQASFKGLREDKSAAFVVRERT